MLVVVRRVSQVRAPCCPIHVPAMASMHQWADDDADGYSDDEDDVSVDEGGAMSHAEVERVEGLVKTLLASTVSRRASRSAARTHRWQSRERARVRCMSREGWRVEAPGCVEATFPFPDIARCQSAVACEFLTRAHVWSPSLCWLRCAG